MPPYEIPRASFLQPGPHMRVREREWCVPWLTDTGVEVATSERHFYVTLCHSVRSMLEESEPETVSLVDLSGLELFNAERLARAIRAGVRRARPPRVLAGAFPEPTEWERQLLTDVWLSEAGRIAQEEVKKRERALAPLRNRARRLEEHESTVRPPWFEGERFLAVAWNVTTARQRFARDAFLTTWELLDAQGSAGDELTLPLVMDGSVRLLGGTRLRMSRTQLDTLVRHRAVTFHYLAEREWSPAYSKALGKLVKACEEKGLVAPRRYVDQGDSSRIMGHVLGSRGRRTLATRTSRPRIWETVLSVADEYFTATQHRWQGWLNERRGG